MGQGILKLLQRATAPTVPDSGIGSMYMDANNILHMLDSTGRDNLVLSRDGWMMALETWTYASTDTVYAAGDVTAIYQVGMRVKYVQSGTTKYACVRSISAYDSVNNRTSLNIYGGTQWVLANAAISGVYFSHLIKPVGFPDSFRWAFTPGGFLSTNLPEIISAEWRLIGRECEAWCRMGVAGTSNDTTFTVPAPFMASSAYGTSMRWVDILPMPVDGGIATAAGYIIIDPGTQVFYLTKTQNAAWTNTGLKKADFRIKYMIA